MLPSAGDQFAIGGISTGIPQPMASPFFANSRAFHALLICSRFLASRTLKRILEASERLLNKYLTILLKCSKTHFKGFCKPFVQESYKALQNALKSIQEGFNSFSYSRKKISFFFLFEYF